MDKQQLQAAPLKTIEEHNAEKRRIHEERNKPRPTGVKCPQCGAELVKKSPIYGLYGEGTNTLPLSEVVWCPHCDWRGSILA